MLTVSEVARHFSSVLDEIERDRQEIILVRNRRQVARLVPEPPAKNALEVRIRNGKTQDLMLSGIRGLPD